MRISRTEEVRGEILRMTRILAAQEVINYKIAQCIENRMIIPPDQEALQEEAARWAGQLDSRPDRASAKGQDGQRDRDRILPLLVLGRHIGIEEEKMEDFLRQMLPVFTIYRADDLRDNPYFRKIAAVQVEEGNFRFAGLEFLPGELFFDREPVSDGYRRLNPMGMFDGRLLYPGLYEGGRCWMSITPNEVVTMEEPIAQAHGTVLTLGLGLGYYAYMVHRKPEVASVTVVEREEAVIDLFRRTLLPAFDHPEKIRIVCADALSYMETLEDGVFDTCFADIWQNPLDGMEDYLAVRHFSNRFSHMECSCWIEESFVGCLEESAAIALQYAFLGEDDHAMYSRPGYAVAKLLLEDVEIREPQDVRDLLGGDYLRTQLRRL